MSEEKPKQPPIPWWQLYANRWFDSDVSPQPSLEEWERQIKQIWENPEKFGFEVPE